MSNVLVTGANRGIGLAFAQAYAKRGDVVIGTAREPVRAIELAKVARVEALDVANDLSAQGLARRLEGMPIDLLINNAGIMEPDTLASASIESMRRQFEVNALGPLRLTRALLSCLRAAKAPRVVNVTSRMGSIGDNGSGGFYGYRASKAALNIITVSLARDLAPIPVLAIHPGMVRTEMVGGHGEVSAPEAVAKMLPLIDRLDSSASGKFLHRDGFELPW